MPPWYLFKKGNFSQAGGGGGGLCSKLSTLFMLDQCDLVKLVMKRRRTANNPNEKILDDQRGDSVPHVSRRGIRGYGRAYSDFGLLDEGPSGDCSSMGSYDCEVTREEMVEDVRGEFEPSESDKERRRFSRSIFSTSESE
jgi:hypothetical protein